MDYASPELLTKEGQWEKLQATKRQYCKLEKAEREDDQRNVDYYGHLLTQGHKFVQNFLDSENLRWNTSFEIKRMGRIFGKLGLLHDYEYYESLQA